MVNTQELSEKYGGKEVRVIHDEVKIGDDVYPCVRLDETDETVISLRAEFEDKTKLRIFLGNAAGTWDYKPTRLNIKISQDDAGAWRIENGFRFG